MNDKSLVNLVQQLAVQLGWFADALDDPGAVNPGSVELRLGLVQLETLGLLMAKSRVYGDELAESAVVPQLLGWLSLAELALHLAVRAIVERAS